MLLSCESSVGHNITINGQSSELYNGITLILEDVITDKPIDIKNIEVNYNRPLINMDGVQKK